MFDTNAFKKAVKDWIRLHPGAEEAELLDYCEELIPPAQYSSYRWLVDQTLSWYRHIGQLRKVTPDEESSVQ